MRSALRAATAALVCGLAGCASAPLEGAPRVESRRFTVVSDVDPGALELALPVLDAVDEELTRRWGFEDRGRRELLLFADEPAWDAFEDAEKPDGERWHGSGFGHEGALALEVPPRSRGDDLSQVSFEQVRRLDDAVEVVSRVTRELFLCRLREHLGQKAFKAVQKELAVGAGEVERTAAMARLDGGLAAPYEPGRSEVERALGALAHALQLGAPNPDHVDEGAPPPPLPPDLVQRERALGSALDLGQERLAANLGVELVAPLSVLPRERPTRPGEHPRASQTTTRTVDRLADVVLRHPSERYVRAAGPAIRIASVLLGAPTPPGADAVGWREAAAVLEAELDRPFERGRRSTPDEVGAEDLDALLLELGVREKQRKEWLRQFCGQT